MSRDNAYYQFYKNAPERQCQDWTENNCLFQGADGPILNTFRKARPSKLKKSKLQCAKIFTWFIVVKHEEELNEPRKFHRFEHLSNETQLTKVNNKPARRNFIFSKFVDAKLLKTDLGSLQKCHLTSSVCLLSSRGQNAS